MHEEQSNAKQLDQGWKAALVTWGSFLASPVVYLVVCLFLLEKKQGVFFTGHSYPMEKIKYALFLLTLIILVVVYFLRKFLLRPARKTSGPGESVSPQHSPVDKYKKAVGVTSALTEAICIYGITFFFLSKDVVTLCLLLGISGLAMLYFRPRKQELLDLATRMNMP